MKLNFDKERFLTHKDRDNISEKSLRGTQPVYIFYAKENEKTGVYDVLHFDWSMSSGVREVSRESAESDIQRYNPEWVIKHELSATVMNETTHLITGYYDLLRNEWCQLNSRKIDGVTAENIFEEMVACKIESYKIFFDDKDLFLKNIEIGCEEPYLTFLDRKDLAERMDMLEYINLVINWFETEKEAVTANTNKENSMIVAPLQLTLNYLKEKNVPEKDGEGRSNFWNLMGLLRVRDVFQNGIYDKKEKKCYDESQYNLINRDDLKTRESDFIEMPLFSQRFLNIYKK